LHTAKVATRLKNLLAFGVEGMADSGGAGSVAGSSLPPQEAKRAERKTTAATEVMVLFKEAPQRVHNVSH
jgi:hypothetical protein